MLLMVGLASGARADLLVLRTAAQDGLLAKFDISNKDRPGICLEIISALQQADPELRFTGLATSMATARVEHELRKGGIDVFLGLLKTPERLRDFRFVEPALFMQSSVVAVRADDPVDVKTFDDIRRLGADGIIMSTQGTAHIAFLKAQPGLLIDDGALNSEANLNKLVLGRGRFFYQGDLNIAFDIAQYGFTDRVRVLPAVFRREGQYLVFARSVSDAVVLRVQKALEKLERSGQLHAIYQRYAPDFSNP